MNVDIDGYFRKLTHDAVQKVDSEIEAMIVRAFGSLEAFMLLKDDFVLEVHDSFPTLTQTEDRNTTTFRIETYYRIRRKTPEEKSLEQDQNS